MSISRIAGVVLGSAALVAGHGYVTGAVVDGTYYGGYLVTQYPYESSPPETIGWSTTATDLGFVDGSEYSNADIICHKSAKPGAIEATVAAGGDVELQWTEWPESHHGPVITYLANCNGDCAKVDKTTLEFFKINEGGLVSDSSVPGTWASDQMISNNNSWSVTIPSSIVAGNYVLRHEIIALHSAGNENGAQNYPQCINLKVTGGGSASPSGTLGTKLYTNTDPGILVNIYQSLSSYTIPGPALWSGSSSGSSSTTSSAAATSAASTSAAASTPAAASTSAAAYSTSTAAAYSTSTAAASISTADAYTSTAAATTTTTTSVTITSTPSAQTQAQDPTSSSAAPTSSSTASVSTPDGSSSLTQYFDSLSADQFLSLLKETFSWLVTDKVHARDTSA
ncbi:hypothetical protein P175DRAFT_0432863 [Aspergillus ochraceoroseus IBT 24754]|uniref:Auxiliary Activity family 9 catalytic domain-containing protein n=3 Tax=Aspergillus subgen. Nidulantes TaxID=2720870 RepID=A0A0F8UUM7_9EURO|nr:uncharacterized protein P175DRAFT_0432863 [Aspergillus ochraceoroseus IBT 24754]KKK20041.1 hypothetical protein AOCH_002302 [Aspergillus ochraceoroseus]KKK23269.1 hypothetical protein ARAM_003287 [Aspergillus rambellii]PTU22740.1 hypothetical protein P175DRAFT_0432863 [Aspergillus ochraceoroseus IBT 24754]